MPSTEAITNALSDLLLTASDTKGATLSGGGRSLGLAELRTAATQAARDVSRAAGRPSPVVAVRLPMSVDAVVMLAAAILGDHTVCFLDPAWPADKAEQVLRKVSAQVLVDETGVHALDAHEAVPVRAAGYVAMSSGSLGGGLKGVLSPWSGVAAFVAAGAAALELDRSSIWGEVSHPAYDMAITNLLVALAAGSSVRVSDTMGDRLRPLRFSDRNGVSHLRVAPRFIDLAVAERRAPGPSLRVWGSGGDRLLSAQLDLLLGLGIPAVINTYGTSESIGFASAARLGRDDPGPSWQGCATIGGGGVGAWQTLLGASNGDAPRLLAIRTPHLPQGYLFGRSFGEYPRWDSGDTLSTGDVGAEVDGLLFCLGRAGRRVKRSGSFVDLDEIDAVIRSVAGAASFTVMTGHGRLVTLCEGDTRPGDLRSALTASLRPALVPDRVVALRQLPRLGNGKIDQAAALARAEQDAS